MAVTRKTKLSRSRLKILKVGFVIVALAIITSPVEACKRIQPLTTYCPQFKIGVTYGNGERISVSSLELVILGLGESECIRHCGRVAGVNAVNYGISGFIKGYCYCKEGVNEIDADRTDLKACLLPDIDPVDCEYNYGPWTTCNKTCGIGTEIRAIRTKSIKPNVNQLNLRCDKDIYETKKCYNFDCDIYPSCDLFEVEFKSANVEPRLDLSIKLSRQPDLDTTIVAQTLQLVNKQNTKIGTEVTWLMNENVKYSQSIIPIYFEEKLTTESKCKARDQNCLISIKNQRLKSSFISNLIVYEKTNIKNKLDHSPELKAWHCPQGEIVLDKWNCDENETIPIFELCNGIKDCLNGRDEEDENCKGSRYLTNAGIALIINLVFSIIIAGLIKYAEQKQLTADKIEKINLKKKHKKNKKKGDKHEKEFFKFLEITCTEDSDWKEEQIKSFTELGIQNRIEAINYFGIVSRKQLGIVVKINDTQFSATPKATEKILHSKKTTTELMKNITSIQLGRSWVEEGISITKTVVCKTNPDENYFGKFSLIKDGILEILKLLMKGQGVYSILTFIFIIVHFNSEILRQEYSQIEGLDLFQITIFMITLLAINSIMTSSIGLQTIHQNLGKWQKLALCLPFCTEAFILFSKLEKYWAKYKIHKELIDANKSKNWPIVITKIKENKQVQGHIELLESATNTMNGVTAAMRNLSFSICTILVIIRPGIKTLMLKTVLKTIPHIITILAAISLATVSMDLTTLKTNCSILSLGYNLYLTGIMTVLLPRVWLTAIFAAQNSALIMLPLIIMSITIFIANQVFNKKFKLLNFCEKMSYCIISSVVPVTTSQGISGGKDIKTDKIDDTADSVTYERKRLFNQGFSICIINLVGLGLISGGILIQSNLNEDYYESVEKLFLMPYNLGLKSTICLGFLSFIVGCILLMMYYEKAHPNKLFLNYYDKLDKFSVLPKVHIDQENIDYNKSPVKTTEKRETLVSRIKKSFRKKRKNEEENTDMTEENVSVPHYSSPIRWVPESKTPSSQTTEVIAQPNFEAESDKSVSCQRRGPQEGQIESQGTRNGEDFEFPPRKIKRNKIGDSKDLVPCQEGDDGWRPTPPSRKKPGAPKDLFPSNKEDIEMQLITPPKKRQKLPNKGKFVKISTDNEDESSLTTPMERRLAVPNKGLVQFKEKEDETRPTTPPIRSPFLENKEMRRETSPYEPQLPDRNKPQLLERNQPLQNTTCSQKPAPTNHHYPAETSPYKPPLPNRNKPALSVRNQPIQTTTTGQKTALTNHHYRAETNHHNAAVETKTYKPPLPDSNKPV